MNTLPVRDWCRDHSDPSLDITHTFIDGGTSRIPVDKLDDLFKCCAFNAFNRGNYAIVERYGEKFRLFVDVDLNIQGVHPGDEYMKTLAAAIDRLVRMYANGPIGPCIVSRPDADPLSSKGRKVGMHLNWHAAVCTKDQGMDIRNLLIQGLSRDNGVSRPDIDWSIAIDAAVFKNGGLRPMWSKKFSNCDACTRASDWKTCSVCVMGKVYDRPYIPTVTFDENGVMGPPPRLDTVDDYLDVLRKTTIQCPAHLPVITRAILPGWFDPAFTLSYNKPHVKTSMPLYAAEYKAATSRMAKESVDPSDDRFKAFEAGVRMAWMSGVYRTTRLTKVDIKDNGQLMAMSDSRYCHIVKRRHKGNHVWFRAEIDKPRTIFQHCHDDDCRKSAERSNNAKVNGTVWGRMYPPKYIPANKAARKRKLQERDAAKNENERDEQNREFTSLFPSSRPGRQRP
jgi:hypothetical protein